MWYKVVQFDCRSYFRGSIPPYPSYFNDPIREVNRNE